MKAPDKIYVRPSAFKTPWPFYIDENANYSGIEYIRKDAFLEWAKEELGSISILRGEAIETLQKVIDKLNSM